MGGAIQQFANTNSSNSKFNIHVKEVNPTYSDDTFSSFADNYANGIPEIWKAVGDENHWWNIASHFIVGTGYKDNVFYINDPEEQFSKISNNYNIVSRIYLKQTDHPFSKFSVFISNVVDAKLIAPDGKVTGRDSNNNIAYEIANSGYTVHKPSYLPQETTISTVSALSDVTLLDEPTDESLADQEIYMSDVEKGTYELVITANQDTPFLVEPYFLNTDNSETIPGVIEDTIKAGQEKRFLIVFNDLEDIIIEPVKSPITFASIREYIEQEYEAGNIKSKGLKTSLLQHLRLAERFAEASRTKLASLMITIDIRMVEKLPAKLIATDTAGTLVEMLEELKESL